jgi:hypothetical protein
MGFFGMAVSAGDLDDDGHADLAVGTPIRSDPELREGGVYVYFGAAELPATRDAADVAIDNPMDEAGGTFGVPLDAAGDANGDGLRDLLIGSSATDLPSHAFLFLGRSDWPSEVATADVTFSDPLSGGLTRFGSAVTSLGDTDGDGFSDIAIAAPFTANPESNEGSVFLWLGRTSWPATIGTAEITFDNPGDLADSHFGAALR